MNMWIVKLCCLLTIVCSATGCAPAEPPENMSNVLFDREKTGDRYLENLSFYNNACPIPGTAGFIMSRQQAQKKSAIASLKIKYSTGDRVNVFVPGAPEFSGDYIISAEGLISIPFIPAITAAGLTEEQLNYRIEKAFIANKLFADAGFRLSVRVIQFSSINVTVSGAVFLPGRITIGGIRDSEKGEKNLNRFGDNPVDRDVAAAIRAAGGVRPDADISRIILVRDGREHVLDWRGAFTGQRVDDLILIDGDHIEVEEANCFQSGLVRPSQITPPGIRTFQSNLTQPVNSNANSAIGPQSQNIPYGTRFLAGLVSANCVGGSLASNARRYGVLISRNPKTLRTEVIQRSIEELVRSPDRDVLNPYLMPDDAIACYDSAVTDAKEAATAIQTILLPFQTAHNVKPW